MNLEQIPESLFDLLSSTPFDELTDDQRAMVSEYLTSSEYNDHRTVITQFQQVDQKIEFQQKQLPEVSDRSWFIEVMTYRIPIYQIAAGMALLAMITYGINQRNNGINTDIINSSQGQSVSSGFYPDSLVFNL